MALNLYADVFDQDVDRAAVRLDAAMQLLRTVPKSEVMFGDTP